MADSGQVLTKHSPLRCKIRKSIAITGFAIFLCKIRYQQRLLILQSIYLKFPAIHDFFLKFLIYKKSQAGLALKKKLSHFLICCSSDTTLFWPKKGSESGGVHYSVFCLLPILQQKSRCMDRSKIAVRFNSYSSDQCAFCSQK